MKTLALAVPLMMLAFASANADDNVLCVQQELAARGLDPGPLDGQLGEQTLSAASAAGLSLAPLSSGTAGAWCRALGPSQGIAAFSQAPRPSTQASRPSANASFPKIPQLCPRYVVDTSDPCFWQ